MYANWIILSSFVYMSETYITNNIYGIQIGLEEFTTLTYTIKIIARNTHPVIF